MQQKGLSQAMGCGSSTTFDLYLAREILKPFVAGLGLFFVVASCGQMLRATDAMTGLGVGAGDIAYAVMLAMPPLLGLLVPISGLYATLYVVGRLASERELWVLAQAGLAPTALLRAPLLLAGVFACVSFGALAVGEPWGIRGLRELLTRGAQKALTQGIHEGRLEVFVPGLVISAEGRDPTTGLLLGVVVAQRGQSQDRPLVISARRGRLVGAQRSEELVFDLQDGTMLLGGTPQDPHGSQLIRFASGQWRLDVARLVGQKVRSLSAVQECSLSELWQRAHAPDLSAGQRALHQVTLQRKLAIPAASLVFALVAVPLGLFARGGAKSRSLLMSTSLVACYYYSGRALELLARSGGFDATLAAWMPNLVALSFAALLWARLARRGF